MRNLLKSLRFSELLFHICVPLSHTVFPVKGTNKGILRADDVGSAHHAAPVPSVKPLSSTARSGRGGPPVRVDTLHPLERSGRRVLTGPRSDAGQTGPQRRRSEGKAATTGAIPRAGSPAPACFLLFCPINGPFSRHFPAPLAHARSDESFGGKRPNHHPLSILHARG